jgi:pimeloyl-ACP methyl ester carboxylesterase
MSQRPPSAAPPSRALLALEMRGLLDMPALIASAPFLATAPRGRRHSVVVLPGLGTDDRSTIPIRRFLSLLGYDVHGWNLGTNIRPSSVDVPRIAQQVVGLHRATGLGVSLVGWSRGGIMAREVARQVPEAVRMVATLGSPFAGPMASNVGSIWKLLTGRSWPGADSEQVQLISKPVPVPATSIYTRQDGVAAWQACLEEEGPERENIEVRTTHIGLGMHPPALWAIADRLALPFGTWRPFKPPLLLSAFFPNRKQEA